MRTAVALVVGGLTFFLGRSLVRKFLLLLSLAALLAAAGCVVERAHADEHMHQCRRISETGEEGPCCRLRDQHGRCTLKGIQICYDRECAVCHEACTPACSGCQ